VDEPPNPQGARGGNKMSLRKKIRSVPQKLSFECDLWAWLQSKKGVSLSKVISKILTNQIAKESGKKLDATR
jgi:hypothetical protein